MMGDCKTSDSSNFIHHAIAIQCSTGKLMIMCAIIKLAYITVRCAGCHVRRCTSGMYC